MFTCEIVFHVSCVPGSMTIFFLLNEFLSKPHLPFISIFYSQ